MRVIDGLRENGQRPSIDVLFRSAADAARTMVCGMLLSGTLDDGVACLKAIQRAGGEAIVQGPADALFPDMPRNAINAGAADRVLPAKNIAPAIVEFVERAARSFGNRKKRLGKI
jgi:two-component system chemotaxis response regulator CheB